MVSPEIVLCRPPSFCPSAPNIPVPNSVGAEEKLYLDVPAESFNRITESR